MTYASTAQNNSNKAEALLPLRNLLYFLLLLAWFISFSPSAKGINFQQTLTHYLDSQIKSYLTRNNMQSDKYDIDLYIPRGSKGLQCEDVAIERAKKSAPPVGRVRLTISCESPKWQFRASAKVNLWTRLVVAKRDLQRSEVLNEEVLTYRSVNIARHLYGMETKISPLLGMQVRRNVRAGDVITRRLLENKYLVNRDQHVDLTVSSGNFTASVTAVALENGQLGQRIKVQNLTSDAIIEGIVVAKGVVETSY